MLPFSCSHRPGVCITRPNCMARSDGGEGKGPSWLVANDAFSLKSASVRWAGWATVTYGRVGKLKTRVGKWKKFSALAHPGLKRCRRPCELQRDQLVHSDYKQFCCSLCSKHCVVQHCRDVMIVRDLTTCILYASCCWCPSEVYECVTQVCVAPCDGYIRDKM